MHTCKMHPVDFVIVFSLGWISGSVFQRFTTKNILHLVSWMKGEKKSPLEKISRTRYSLKYHHRGDQYKIIVPVRRGPHQRKLLKVLNEHGHDVTEDVLPFSGPAEDFHQQHVTPADTGHAELQFFYIDRPSQKFSGDDKLVI